MQEFLTQQHPLIQRLAQGIEATWSQYLDLEPYALPNDLGFIEGQLEGERLTIQNRCYQSTVFRKMHLELARVGNGLDILHCVMFPRLEYALPMFGTDLVGGRGLISAAIVDLSPVLGLPLEYQEAMDTTRKAHTFSGVRQLPEWGNIFSEYCLFIRPDGPEEQDRFVQVALAYLDLHCQLAQTAINNPDLNTQVWAGQAKYCNRQQENDKTRRILEKAFGPAWAERYLQTVLFDLPAQP